MVTYFVVQSFQRGNKGMLIAHQPRQARDLTHCIDMADRLAPSVASVIAFSRRGEPETGEWEDAVVLKQHGDVPVDMFEGAN